jgi:hypothetical protein
MGNHPVVQSADGRTAGFQASKRQESMDGACQRAHEHGASEGKCLAHMLEIAFADRGGMVGEWIGHGIAPANVR